MNGAENMKYSINYQTRWHDTDAERLVRPSALLVYMQETSNRHVASTGISLDELRDSRNLAFILSRIRIAIHRRPRAFEDIKVETWTVEPRGYSSIRCFRILAGDEVLCESDSTWALVDTVEKKLHKFDETPYVFENEDPLVINAPSRTRAPSSLELIEVGKRDILYSDLDYNMHMNNTRYPDMLCDYLPIEDVSKISSITLSYLNEAAFGKTITVFCGKLDGAYYFKTVNDDGVVCLEAVVGINE